jgi:uncharacterized membrane protein
MSGRRAVVCLACRSENRACASAHIALLSPRAQRLTPGTSALFLLAESAVADRIIPELKALKPELLTTNLQADKEARLRELFAEAQPVK